LKLAFLPMRSFKSDLRSVPQPLDQVGVGGALVDDQRVRGREYVLVGRPRVRGPHLRGERRIELRLRAEDAGLLLWGLETLRRDARVVLERDGDRLLERDGLDVLVARDLVGDLHGVALGLGRTPLPRQLLRAPPRTRLLGVLRPSDACREDDERAEHERQRTRHGPWR
jgi:hypothetical protein